MIVQLSKRPKAWINTLVLAGMTVLVPSRKHRRIFNPLLKQMPSLSKWETHTTTSTT